MLKSLSVMSVVASVNSQVECAWLETLLKKYADDNSVSRVTDITVEDAGQNGENYASQICRIRLRIILGSGRTCIKTLIMKKPILKEDGSQLIDEPIFKSETKVYREILYQFDALMQEFQDPNDKLWCDLIGFKPYNVIVLEDLKVKNFYVPDRRNCLDLNHALLVMNSFGRFHALSRILLKRGILNIDDLGKHLMESNNITSARLMQGAFQQLSCVMESHWPSEWKEVAKKFAKESEVVCEKIRKAFEFQKDGFLVLNHGDCWTCNLMFKYCPYEESLPTAVKFLDFQLCHFNSYILDIVHFLYMSVRPDIRRENINILYMEYQKSLETTLNFYGFIDSIPSLNDIYAEAKRVEYLSMFFCMASLPVTTIDVTDSFYMDKLQSDGEPKDAYNPESFKSEKFRKSVEIDLKNWISEGLI